MTNLLSRLEDYFSPEVIQKAATLLGETPEKTQVAVTTIAQSIFVTLIKRASTESGLRMLGGIIERRRFNGSLLGKIHIPADTLEETVALGNGVFSQILPDKRSPLVGLVSPFAKIKNSSASAMIGLATASVFDLLGQQAQQQNLDASGIANLLNEQKSLLAAQMPEEFLGRLTDTLGIANFENLSAAVAEVPEEQPVRYSKAYNEEESQSSFTIPWRGILAGLGVLGLLAAGYFAWQFYGESLAGAFTSKSSEKEEVATPVATPDTLKKVTPPVQVAAKWLTKLTDTTQSKGAIFEVDGLVFNEETNQLDSLANTAVLKQALTIFNSNPLLQAKFTGIAPSMMLKNAAFKRANSIKGTFTKLGIDNMRLDAGSIVVADTTRNIKITLKIIQR